YHEPGRRPTVEFTAAPHPGRRLVPAPAPTYDENDPGDLANAGQIVAQRPRIIVVDGPERAAAAELARALPGRELVHGPDLTSALEQSREDGVQGVYVDTQAATCREQADRLTQ